MATDSSSSSDAKSIARMQGISFSGPLPPPEILQKYDLVIPGLAERIVSMAEKEQHHVHLIRREQLNLETIAHKEQMSYFRRGQWFGFVLALIFAAISTALAFASHETAASALGGTTILGIVLAYIIGYLRPDSTKSDN